ncbi:MAG: DUF4347 domain-containing protein, partial [Desulfosudaceae bacterium]
MLRNKKSNQAGAKGKKKKRGAERQARPFQFEALEPRLLLSAELGIPPADPEDLGVTPAPVVENVDRFNDVTTTPAGDGLKNGETEALTRPAPEEDFQKADQEPLFSNNEAGGISNTDLRQVIIVDAAVTDRDDLVEAMVGSREDAHIFDLAQEAARTEPASSGSLFDLYLLDGNRDGIEQVSEILDGYQGLDAVHLFSHGDAGSIRLGDTLVTGEELTGRRDDLAAWGESLDSEGDLLLYGCGVAEGDTGASFVETLASFTRADVAASVDPTGNADLGGDWDLEYTAGAVETPALSGSLADYSHLLETFVSTEDNETFTGTANDDFFSFEDGWG